ATRGSAPCTSAPPATRCSFLRSLKAKNEEGGARNRFSEAIAPITEGESISEAATLLYPTQSDFGEVVSSGPIGEVLQAWQTPPPGAGKEYKKVVSSNEANESEKRKAGNWTFWVDTETGLPIKASLQEGSESPTVSYYSYAESAEEAGSL